MKIPLTVLVREYSEFQRSMVLSENSISNAQTVLQLFVKTCGAEYVHTVTGTHVAEFMNLSAKTRSANSLVNTHTHLSTFFTWCVETGRLKPSANPMNGRRRPRSVDRERTRLHVSKFNQLMDCAVLPRDRALVAMGLFALTRDSEMASMRVKDVDLADGYVLARIHKSHVEDRIPLGSELDTELRRWFMAYQKECGPLQPEWLLFPFAVKTRMRANGRATKSVFVSYNPYKPAGKASSIVTPLLPLVGIPTRDGDGKSLREGGHTLRRSGARAFYDAQVGAGRVDALRLTQSLLHHKNIVVTEHYIGLGADRATRNELVRGKSLLGYTVDGDNVKDDGDGETADSGTRLRQVRQA